MKTFVYNILIVLAIISGVKAEAQTIHYHYRFSYDNNGNREKRIYLGTELKSASLESSVAFDELEPIIDNIGLGKIRIYPNPTKGNLVIEIPDLECESIRIMVFNIQGKQFITKRVSPNTRTLIQMSDLSSGIYVLKILAEQESSEWKIIKE